MMLLVTPVQLELGDAHGLNTLKHEPAKIAAIEGHWQNVPGQSVPLILFGWPDMTAETTRYALEVPVLGSLILTHDWNGHIPGLKEFAPDDRPNSTVIFWTFRLMVGLGMPMLLLGVSSAWLGWRGRLFQSPLFLRFAVLMGPAGLLAILAGWITTEMGRQPWVVYGLLKTSDARSPNVSLTEIVISLTAYIVVYVILIAVGARLMAREVQHGPEEPPGPAGGPAAGEARSLENDLVMAY